MDTPTPAPTTSMNSAVPAQGSAAPAVPTGSTAAPPPQLIGEAAAAPQAAPAPSAPQQPQRPAQSVGGFRVENTDPRAGLAAMQNGPSAEPAAAPSPVSNPAGTLIGDGPGNVATPSFQPGQEQPQAAPAQGEAQAAQSEAAAAPAHYEYFFPEMNREDNTVQVLQNNLEQVAKAHNWDQETATKHFTEFKEAFAKAQLAQAERWRQETLLDPDIGGANWTRTQSNANRAFQQFLTDSERAFIRGSGALNNKEVIALLARIGERLSPETVPAGLVGSRRADTQQKPVTLRDFYRNYDK